VVDNTDEWLKRAEEVLGLSSTEHGAGTESSQFATSMLSALYGLSSPQTRRFLDGIDQIAKASPNPRNFDFNLAIHARGAIRNCTAELKAGLITRQRILIEGEVLGEMIRLSKDALEEKVEPAKNVAAVLTAAAYEGLLRKMGEEFANVLDRPKLELVIGKLKDCDVLKGGQVATALSYLKLRNDSLHADWHNVDRSQVESCLAFCESLLLKHFAG